MTATLERPEAPITHDLARTARFELRDSDAGGDGLTFTGYAAVFNSPTIIDSYEGRFREQIAPGAFKRTLRAQTPVLQFDHGRHPMVGSIPIGSIRQAAEDEHGVFVDARLEDNWLVQPVRDALASRSIDGMSFRFEVLRDEWLDPATGKPIRDVNQIMERIWSSDGQPDDQLLLRTLKEVRCAELGPVVFPAYPDTTAAVRSVDLTRMDDPDTRRALAYAALFPNRTQELPDTSPEGTADAPADHDVRDDSPQGTADDAPAEHESETAEPAGLRDQIKRWRASKAPTIRHALEGASRYE